MQTRHSRPGPAHALVTLGHQSREVGLFKDDDGSAHLMHDAPAGFLRVDRLSADHTAARSWYPSWGIDPATGPTTLPTFRLTGSQSGRCPDISGGSRASGVTSRVGDCNGDADQGWNRG
jgi:hypothetical protein